MKASDQQQGGCCGGKSGKSKKQQDELTLRKQITKGGRPDLFNGPASTSSKVIDAKVVLLGDSGVGKSSIAQRYCKNIFSESHDVTIGGAYLQQTVSL